MGVMIVFMTIKQAAEKWELSDRRIQILCAEGSIPGAFQDGNSRIRHLLVNLELMKADYPPIDTKFTDRLAYCTVFDAYYMKHNLLAMEKLLTGYINERLDTYLSMLRGK